MRLFTVPLIALASATLLAQAPAPSGPARVDPPAGKPSASEPAAAPAQPESNSRIELNLLGKTDASAGESRRNENIQFNLVDNNALKELNVRMGTTVTIIQEYRPERSYFGADFGAMPVPVLHIAPQSPAGLHGRIYETHQNSVLGARSFFQVGGVKPAHDNDYGFRLGGRSWRGAYLSGEASRQQMRGSVNGNVLVPRADERTALTTDPVLRPMIQHWLDAYPDILPNRPDVNARALNTNAPQTIDSNTANLRLDQDRGGRDRFYSLYSFTSQKVMAFQLVAGQNPNTDTRSHRSRLTWNRPWSASTVTSVSAGFDRVVSRLTPDQSAVGPTVATSGLETLGPLATIPIIRVMNAFRTGGQIEQRRGNHTWTAGMGLARRQLNGTETDCGRGYFSFAPDFGNDAITNLRLGLPVQYIVLTGNLWRGFRNLEMQGYIGDTWRTTRNLTLYAGLRWQPVTRPHEVNGAVPVPYHCDCNAVAPRFGFAWRLPGESGTLRGSYALDYGEIFAATYQQLRFSPPAAAKRMVPIPNLADPAGALSQTGLPPEVRTTTYNLDPKLSTPYAHQYSLSWETRLPGNWHLQLGYAGNRSHKLLIMWYTNRSQPVPGVPLTTATYNQRRADPGYAEIRRVLNGSHGYFDAARVALVVPRWRGISMDVAYSFSKALDLGSSYTNTAYDNDSRESRSQSEFETQKDMKGLSSFHQPHAFLWRVAYATPAPGTSRLRKLVGAWDLSAVTLLKTGTPFTVFAGADGPGYGNVDANGGDRPNLLDTTILGRTVGNPDDSRKLLPRSAFGYIALGEAAGSLGRNTFRKGSIQNVNAAVSRTFTLRAEKRLVFRAESINLFNTPQFAAPGTDLVSNNFGQITNTLNDGRIFRLTLQFGF